MRMRRWVGPAVAVVLVIGAILVLDPTLRPAWIEGLMRGGSPAKTGVLSSPDGDEMGLQVGNVAPNFALRSLEGDVVRLSDYRGRRKVVLNFWATWCPPCKGEMPDFEEAYREHRANLVILGVNLAESPRTIRQFLRNDVHVTYPILLDSEGDVRSAYNLFAQPTTYFIDVEGRIAPIGRSNGKFGAFTTEEFEKRISEFLER